VEAAVPVLTVFTALLIGALLIAPGGGDVYTAYGGLFEGMLGSRRAVFDTLVTSTPYILTGLAVAFGFQGGLFNIGAEGQFYIGALCAAFAGYAFSGLPGWAHLPAALAAGMAGGALWGAIPGALKAAVGAHEVINTIMLNYVAIHLVDYLVKKILRDPSATVDRTPTILPTAALPRLIGPDHRLHAGVLLAFFAVITVYWIIRFTKPGFSIRTVGANPDAARYAGIRVGAVTVLTLAAGGGLAGLAGAVEVLGLEHSLPAAFSAGYGYDAIAVAFLARSNPVAVLPAALLWGGLKNGAGLMQLRAGVSIDLINVVQALVIVLLAADPLIRRLYRLPRAPAGKIRFTRRWGK
jgi:simple sugar transport system permease protein